MCYVSDWGKFSPHPRRRWRSCLVSSYRKQPYYLPKILPQQCNWAMYSGSYGTSAGLVLIACFYLHLNFWISSLFGGWTERLNVGTTLYCSTNQTLFTSHILIFYFLLHWEDSLNSCVNASLMPQSFSVYNKWGKEKNCLFHIKMQWVFKSKLYLLSHLWSKIEKMQLIFSIDL